MSGLTTPGAFAETSGTASWTATATASGGRTVAKVEFLVDDVVKATDTTAPYGGTYTVPAFTPGWSGDNGPYTVAARVTDSAGVARKTLSRTLYHQHAGIAWIGPSLMNGGTWVDGPLRVPAGKTVPLTVRAWSSSALGIQRVVFRVNGVTVATDYSAPYTYDYVISSTLGTQVEVTTRAIDGAGTIVTSDPIYIKSVSTYGSQTPTITPDPVSSGADVTFKLTTTPPSGGVIDSACLYVDGDYGDGCVYPSSSSENTITVPAATFGVGGHTASWHLTGNTKADYTGTYVQVDSGYRRFTVTGSTSTPTVAVTGLTTGGRYKGKVNVGATVTGLSSAVTVQQVEFFEGGSSLGLDYDASYTWSWNSAVGPDGPRTIAAEVTLSDGSHLRGSIDVDRRERVREAVDAARRSHGQRRDDPVGHRHVRLGYRPGECPLLRGRRGGQHGPQRPVQLRLELGRGRERPAYGRDPTAAHRRSDDHDAGGEHHGGKLTP